ncbi:hypothetical protein [Aeromicrobium alkaliterrae]|uniref:Uncharacterized protein n=1 Tax=Aeromicrobium alkaliterrae TaxID=302168 RepID=A0ABN2JNF8_9ACTN
MAWSWTYENADGDTVGTSETFDARGDAESWIGEEYPDLLDDGVAQVRLLEDGKEVYGPMSLSPE